VTVNRRGKSIRNRRLKVARDLEAFIERMDQQVAAGAAVDHKLARERGKLAAVVLRALREAQVRK
jgi:hypothetical protein